MPALIRTSRVIGFVVGASVSMLCARSGLAAPNVYGTFANYLSITPASPINDVTQPSQIAWGPDGRLYVARAEEEIVSYAWNATTGSLSDQRPTGVHGMGVAFATHAVPGTSARGYMYVSHRENGFEAVLSRYDDTNGNFRWGEAGEVNADIVRGVPLGDHSMNHIQIAANQTLYVGIGDRANNGRAGIHTGAGFYDTPAGPVTGGFFRNAPDTTYGETSYNGAIAMIQNLSLVPNTTSAAQLRDGPNGQSGNLLAGRDAFLPGAPFATMPLTSTAPDKLIVHSAGTRNPFGVALDAANNPWFTNNYSRSNTNGNGTSEPILFDLTDSDISNDVHDQLFKAVQGGDYRYDTQFRGNPAFPTTIVKSKTFDNLDSSAPGFGALHKPADPDGLGPDSSSNGLDFVTMNLSGVLPGGSREFAVISRWTEVIGEEAPGTDVFHYQDLVVVDPNTGKTLRAIENFANPIDVIKDGTGGFLVADFTSHTIYRVSVATPSVWNNSNSGIWSTGINWQGGVPNGVGAIAQFAGAISSPRVVNVDSAKTVGVLSFDNANRYSLVGSATISLQSPGTAAIQVASGSHTIAAPLLLLSDTQIDVQPSGSVLSITAMQATTRSITKIGSGRVEFNALVANALNVNGGNVRITGATAGKLQSVAVVSSATLDVGSAGIVIDYTGASPIDSIEAAVRNARAGGTWAGTGITSSTVIADHTFGVAVVEAGSISLVSYHGQSADTTSVVIGAALLGDTDLSGTVNFTDLLTLAQHYGSAAGQHWNTGDFTLDNAVGFDDLLGVAQNYGRSALNADGSLLSNAASPDVFAHDWQLALSVVPEPTMLTGVLASVSLCRRTRR